MIVITSLAVACLGDFLGVIWGDDDFRLYR